jgi:mRNA-degrading endonuclease RelE of RelBE toxin-antitoxin system
MADEIAKFLAKVTQQERIFLVKLIDNIVKNAVSQHNVKKLVGSKDIFRLKKGKFRIIFKKTANDCLIISISRRSEKTYRDF